MHVVVYNYEITAYLIPTWMNSINNVPTTLSRSPNA